jgi:hypothetical protein
MIDNLLGQGSTRNQDLYNNLYVIIFTEKGLYSVVNPVVERKYGT